MDRRELLDKTARSEEERATREGDLSHASELRYSKIPELKAMIEKSGRDILIEVDGGVKRENAEKVVRAGADVLVIGTGLFRADDPKAVVREVLACAEA